MLYVYKDVIVHQPIYICGVYDLLFLIICQLKNSDSEMKKMTGVKSQGIIFL